MNRYAPWQYGIIVMSMILAIVYTLPNFFGESPAVQISSTDAAVTVDQALQQKALAVLDTARVKPEGVQLETGKWLTLRFDDTETQLKVKDLLQSALGSHYTVALNLLPLTPGWLRAIGAKPMFLGLDLRGGVHFLLEVDMKTAQTKALEKIASDLRRALKAEKIRYGRITREREQITVRLRDATMLEKATQMTTEHFPQLQRQSRSGNREYMLFLSLAPHAIIQLKNDALQRNIMTLRNRVNELGVVEPIIQQQGDGRIVVELPGIQDTAKAKAILGRTASLEIRRVDDDRLHRQQALSGNVPSGTELLYERGPAPRTPVLVKKDIELTGEHINGAQAGFDDHNQPAVFINLDGAGSSLFQSLTRDTIGKRIAIVLSEKNKSEVATAPVVNSEISGGRVMISGAMTLAEANELALLLRAGSLAAPMNMVEERTIGPSLGKENIIKGFNSTLYGFVVIVLFMVFYYRIFGLASVLALGMNLLLLVALLSLLQATLTLPGIAAIALTLGMAIDANVLINERVREELRNGMSAHMAISNGYQHAFATILDSNITTLIAGLALFIVGSGPVRGFAVVHCLGILTSIYSSVFVSRGLVNLVYGWRHRIKRLAV